MAITALAGPVSNFLLAVVLLGISKLISLYAPYNAVWMAAFEFCLYTAAPLSVGLGLFNLLPIPPLDGSRLWSTFLPLKWRLTLERYSNLCIILLFALLLTGALDGVLDGLTRLIGNSIFQLFDLPYYFA
jgi:Zn-dependent protease